MSHLGGDHGMSSVASKLVCSKHILLSLFIAPPFIPIQLFFALGIVCPDSVIKLKVTLSHISLESGKYLLLWCHTIPQSLRLLFQTPLAQHLHIS